MRVLVWQWSRFGGLPRFAAFLTDALRALPDTEALLSLSTEAELLRSAAPPHCDLPVGTYRGLAGFVLRVAGAPFGVWPLAARIRRLAPDVAVCAQPGPLDLLMAAALRLAHVPFVVLVHDAEHHPGDGLPLQMVLQRTLCRQAAAVGALSAHVGQQLIEQGLAGTPSRPLIRLTHPPISFAVPPPRARSGGMLRVLFFGRLLPYKGLGLLAEAVALLGPQPGLEVRVAGSGPESAELEALRALPGVAVENRWVPEDAVGALLAWSDAVVLPYREATQSGVAAAALAAGRRVLATRVGGMGEQLRDAPLAVLCEPDAESVAEGLRRLLAEPASAGGVAVADTGAAWRDMAASLRRQIEPLRNTVIASSPPA
jgi:glycosyltransferase involved in cell wall biosynthesis